MNIVFLTNILNPYRMKFFDLIYDHSRNTDINLKVLAMVGEKSDRPTWHYDDFKREYTVLLENRTVRINGIYLHFNKNLINLLENIKPDLIICSGSYLQPSVIKTLIFRKKLNCKVYLWSESHLNEKRKYNNLLLKIREIIRKALLNKFDGFLYAGLYSKQFVDKYKSEKAECYLLHNIVDDNYFYKRGIALRENRKILRNKYGFPDNKYIFFSPIRLSHEKGIGSFFSCIRDIDKSLKEKIVFAIAGFGTEKNAWEKLAKKYGFTALFLGMKDQEEISELYAASDCMLLPSASDPNPLSVIEAAWSGIPLMVSKNVGNWPEIMRNRENGYVFDYDNPATIEEILKSIVNRDEKWILNARKTSYDIVTQNYESKTVVDSLLGYFISLEERDDAN